MKSNTIFLVIVGVLALGLFLFWAGRIGTDSGDKGELITDNGIHWHPTLTINIDGAQRLLPANLGLTDGHSQIHTHAEDVSDGVVHFEFDGEVFTDDLRLKNLFRLLGSKDMRTTFGRLERMMVNGEENTEYGDYVVGWNDAIELFYTTGSSVSVPATD